MDCTTNENAIATLQTIYRKPKNEIFPRHLQAIRREQNGESLEHFLKELQTLSKNSNFRPMNAKEIQDEHIMDILINGLQNA